MKSSKRFDPNILKNKSSAKILSLKPKLEEKKKILASKNLIPVTEAYSKIEDVERMVTQIQSNKNYFVENMKNAFNTGNEEVIPPTIPSELDKKITKLQLKARKISEMNVQ